MNLHYFHIPIDRYPFAWTTLIAEMNSLQKQILSNKYLKGVFFFGKASIALVKSQGAILKQFLSLEMLLGRSLPQLTVSLAAIHMHFVKCLWVSHCLIHPGQTPFIRTIE